MLDQITSDKDFQYLSLIFKYFDKNNEFIKTLITLLDNSDAILLKYLKVVNKGENENDKFLHDYFEILDKMKYSFSEQTFNQIIKMCQDNENLLKYGSFIKEKYNKLKIHSK